MRDGITITNDDPLQPVTGSVESVSGPSLSVDLVDLFRESKMKHWFLQIRHEIPEEKDVDISISKIGLAFVRSGYLRKGTYHR